MLWAVQGWLRILTIKVFFGAALIAIAIAVPIAIGWGVLRLILAKNNSEDTRPREMQPFQSVADEAATSFSAFDHQDGSINDTAQYWDVRKAHYRRSIDNDDIEELGGCGQQQT